MQLFQKQWEQAWRDRGSARCPHVCAPPHTSSLAEALRLERVALLAQAAELEMDAEGLHKLAEDWKARVLEGADPDAEQGWAVVLARCYLLLDIDNSPKTAEQEALLASLGKKHFSDSMRKAAEKLRGIMELKGAINAATRAQYRASPAAAKALAEFCESGLARARVELVRRAGLYQMALDAAAPERVAGAAGRMRFGCVPGLEMACVSARTGQASFMPPHPLTPPRSKQDGPKSMGKARGLAATAELLYRRVSSPTAAAYTRDELDGIAQRGSLPWTGSAVDVQSVRQQAMGSLARKWVEVSAKTERIEEAIGYIARADAEKVICTYQRISRAIHARMNELSTELDADALDARDAEWAQLAVRNRALLYALTEAWEANFALLKHARVRWSVGRLRTSPKRQPIPPLLSQDMLERLFPAELDDQLNAEPELVCLPLPVADDAELGWDQSERDDDSESDAEADGSDEAGECAGEEAMPAADASFPAPLENGGQAGEADGRDGATEMEVDAAAAADAGSAGEEAPAKPAHVHAGVGCCAGGVVVPFQLSPPVAKAATPPPGSAFPSP